MVTRILVALCAFCVSIAAAHAQSQTNVSPYVKYTNGIVYISQISSIGIETKLSDGRDLKLPRHQVGGIASYAKCGGGSAAPGKPCVGLPKPISTTLFFHEAEFNSDSAARKLLAVCRRTMESASPKDTVQLDGDFEVSANPSFIVFHSLRSCRVTRNSGF
jgi:Holliday junction resolvase